MQENVVSINLFEETSMEGSRTPAETAGLQSPFRDWGDLTTREKPNTTTSRNANREAGNLSHQVAHQGETDSEDEGETEGETKGETKGKTQAKAASKKADGKKAAREAQAKVSGETQGETKDSNPEHPGRDEAGSPNGNPASEGNDTAAGKRTQQSNHNRKPEEIAREHLRVKIGEIRAKQQEAARQLEEIGQDRETLERALELLAR